MKEHARVLFLSHGGGPLPLLGDRAHEEMVDCLKHIAAKYPKPSAIVLVSAHWEEKIPTITSGSRPDLIYDYYGFPEESYEIQYPCPGEPRLAEKIHGLLDRAGIASRLDAKRGFDHGLFVPLKLMYPEADIPCVQLSLASSLDPALHIAMGRALRGLEDDGLLVVGSGFSFHNMRAFFGQETTESAAMNAAFEEWLLETCSSPDLDEEERERRLIQWAEAPSARYCHPREEHLLPLQFCYGWAQTRCSEAFELRIMGKKSSMYLWRESSV
ncbi:DODA-type extradiol aromatic ring-opening family dioxygenase [Imhoffiella purpurea]|uniref:Putative cytoplasmic protein n=1 Tax=Imhoffiella purpurea TaxID=1249627 RepID=W9VK87_9GAMM|nr:class III extradiol ring-cleavage dioxygenase [Imhoffiella purpurea]EXJ16497.1 Putative cytoplasmic protein [Imhoffiella purpurea]